MTIKKFIATALTIFAFAIPLSQNVNAWDWGHVISGGVKLFSAATITDDQVAQYVKQYVSYQDKQSKVASENSPYTQRLRKITTGLTNVGKIPLNFKVYITPEINAFACADGSVRVYSGLMDRMTDDEILAVVGHEIGHVANKDTKRAFKHSLITSALLDGIGATGSTMAALTDSQLGTLAHNLMTAGYSRKEESQADDYSYNFLKKTGKNPWVLASAFTKLSSMESNKSTSSNVRNLFSSHPSTPDRIRKIAQKARKDKFPQPEGLIIP